MIFIQQDKEIGNLVVRYTCMAWAARNLTTASSAHYLSALIAGRNGRINMGWGSYIQNGFDEELDQLGAQLSVEISCPVHYPAYGKHMFECKCDVVFPVYIVKGGDWDMVRQKHEEER